MRVLYGVVGEGMGHAVRSRVVLEYLLEQRHELLVVASGKAYPFLAERFAGRPGIRFEKIHGLHLNYEGNAVDLGESVSSNLEALPRNVLTNTEAYRRVRDTGFQPQVVVSDFEYWAYLFGRLHRVPVISLDNMKVLDRCYHDPAILKDAGFAYRLAKAAVRVKLAWAYHYLISSFFFPSIRKPRTTLLPPILRPEVLAARRHPGEHVVVYQSAAANTALVSTLRKLPYRFRVYGLGRTGEEGNVTLCPFSETGFLEDLRTARGVIAGGGFTLMGEAVHLGVPMLSVPLEGHFEQELNSRYLEHLGYGAFARELTPAAVERFLAHTHQYTEALQEYPAQDNDYLYCCLDELFRHVQRGDPPPMSLSSAAIRGMKDGRPPAEG